MEQSFQVIQIGDQRRLTVDQDGFSNRLAVFTFALQHLDGIGVDAEQPRDLLGKHGKIRKARPIVQRLEYRKPRPGAG